MSPATPSPVSLKKEEGGPSLLHLKAQKKEKQNSRKDTKEKPLISILYRKFTGCCRKRPSFYCLIILYNQILNVN